MKTICNAQMYTFLCSVNPLLVRQSSKVVSSELNVSKEFSVSAVLKVEAFPELKIYLLFHFEDRDI